jgi:hypothetical protein
MTTTSVMVHGERYDVTTHHKSKSVWIASGEYMGERKSTQDQSEGAAIRCWREWAEYKGN